MDFKFYIVILILTSIISCSKEENIPIETNPYVPLGLYDRENNYFGCIEIESLDAQIEVWDNSTPDSDKINLYANGDKDILLGHFLENYYNRKIINYKFNQYGYNYLLFKAQTLGYHGYNEIRLSVNGKQVIVETNLVKNGYVQVVIPREETECINEERSLSSIMFWNNSPIPPEGCYSFEAHIEGFEKQIVDGYWTGVEPDCGAQHCATFRNLPRGTYDYIITCSNSEDVYSSGTVEVSGEPKCYKINVFHL